MDTATAPSADNQRTPAKAPYRWLGRETTPSQSTMNSRAYKSLEKLSLAKRHNFDGERKATHLQLTEAGETLARQLTKDEAA